MRLWVFFEEQILFAASITWFVCYILTEEEVFSSQNMKHERSATDYRIDYLQHAPWFRFPYPGKHPLIAVHVVRLCPRDVTL